MPASSSLTRWVVVAAAGFAVVGILVRVADRGDVERRAPAPAEHAAAARQDGRPTPAPREAAPASRFDAGAEPDADARAGEPVARAPSGDADFPDVLGPGFRSGAPSSASIRRAQRAIERRKAREARRQAQLAARRTGDAGAPAVPGGPPGAPPRAPGTPAGAPPAGAPPATVPPSPAGEGVVFQSDAAVQYTLDTPVDVNDLTKLAGASGAVSFWLQPEWQAGNQDDADLVDIGDGRLQIIKNVSFLRLEFTDDAGETHGIGAPIPEWKTGEWHQVAGSWNGGTFQLYFDGQLVSQATIGNPFTLPTETGMTIGSDFPANRPIAPGVMGGLGVQNQPLSANEVLARFKAGAGR